MAVSAGDRELDLIDAVIGKVTERLGHEPPVACQEFVRQLFHWVPAQDLNERTPEDLAGMALSQFELAAHRERAEPKVRVYNPDRERDGTLSHAAAAAMTPVGSVRIRLTGPAWGIRVSVTS